MLSTPSSVLSLTGRGSVPALSQIAMLIASAEGFASLAAASARAQEHHSCSQPTLHSRRPSLQQLPRRLPAHASAASQSSWRLRQLHASAALLETEAGSRGQGAGAGSTATSAAMEAAVQAHAAARQLVGAGRHLEAESALREGISAVESTLGEGAAAMAAPLYELLASIGYINDRLESARAASQRAYELRLQREGGSSPATALAAVRFAVLLLAGGQPVAALETLRGTQEVLQAALSVELEQLPAGEEEEALGEVLKGGREALEAMDLEELRHLTNAMAARKRAEVCEVGVGESVFYETLAKLALQRPQDEGAVNGAGVYLRLGLQLMQANSRRELHQPCLDFALREHFRLVERAAAAGDSGAVDLLSQQHSQLQNLCNGA